MPFVVERAMQTCEEKHPMTNRFLISVAAAALIAGTGFANAQGMSREGGAAAGGAATQTAPSSDRAAPSGAMNHDSGATGMKGAESSGAKGSGSGMKAESNEKMPASKSAQDTKMDTKGEKSKGMSSENDSAKGGKDMKAEGRDSKSGNTAEGRDRDSKSGSSTAEGRDSKNGNMNAQTKTGADSKTTTGNAATSATAAPPAEKRTQIVSAIKSEHIEETTNVNFNISVGATVPGTVRFHPLPARIVEIYPEWRGYDVIFVHGRYIIVRPQTHEIVYIIEG
jgi:uncharacterized protein DUF1236